MFLAEMSQADKERAQGRRIKFASKEGRQPHLTPIVALDFLLTPINICLRGGPPIYLFVFEGKPQ